MINWVEDFSTDPIAAGRFIVAPGSAASRFSYNGSGPFLTVHYDSQLPTAFCWRPVDPVGLCGVCRTRDFEFSVTFRIRSDGFFADPNQFAQIGWGLVNSASTGGNRAGNDPPGAPYAFNVATFDYFPNVSPLFGGPTLAGTAIHANVGQSFFEAFEFPFGAESDLDADAGDEGIALDTIYTARVSYVAAEQVMTVTLRQGATPVQINVDGSGGPGGPDGDATTIQTFFFSSDPLGLDRFALTAWEDSFNTVESSVRADVDIFAVSFLAPASNKGDMNGDNAVDGRDVAMFVQTLTAVSPSPNLVERADFTYDDSATLDDVAGFVETLLCP